MTSRYTVDDGAIEQLLVSPSGPVAGDLLRRGRNVEGEGKRLAPVDVGRLRSSITHELITVGGQLAVRIGTNVAYALAVHEGTGLWGPKGTPIVPKRTGTRVVTIKRGPRAGKTMTVRPALAWKDKATKQMVFRASVKGMPGRPYLRNALPAAAR